MESRETNAQGHNLGPFVPVQRLAYRSPALVEYGNVSRLTEGTSTSGNADVNRNAMRINGTPAPR